MIRTIDVREISKNIKEMCIEANHYLSKDMDTAMKQAEQDEKSPLGKQILGQLQENLKIAADDMIPICQDNGKFKGGPRAAGADLPGYRNGSYISGNRAGCASGGWPSGRGSQ